MSGSRPNLTGYRRFGIIGLLLAVLAATGLNHPSALAIQDDAPALAIQDGTSATGPALTMQGDPSAGRPNIIVIMSDDQGWNDIGYHGSEILTPNLDRLAKEGVRFSQFYAYSTCSPSRVALLTGQHPAALGVFGPLGETTEVQPKDVLLPFGLQEAGYSTHISGKWHIGDRPEHRPLRHGFTTSYGYLRGQIDPWTHRYKFGDYVTWHRNDHYIEETGHVTELITDEAVRVIRNAAEVSESPFFLYVAHHAPHYPHNTLPRWIEPYEEAIDDVWRRHHAASVTHMDHEIGRIIDALEQTGLRDDTIIIFMSDNGGQLSWGAPEQEYNGRYAPHTTLGDNYPLRGWKTDLYEGGIRVPALINWPGGLQEGVVDQPVHILDWVPTLLEMAEPERPLPEQLAGESLWSLFAGSLRGGSWQIESYDRLLTGSTSSFEDRPLYWRQSDLRAVRTGPWKLIARGDDLVQPELFNLSEDPYEEQELGEAHPEKRDELLDRLRQWIGHDPDVPGSTLF